MTRELTEKLRRNQTVDWQLRESARAKMRMMVRRLLDDYHYPPDGQEEALDTVMEQCELWADQVMDTSVLTYDMAYHTEGLAKAAEPRATYGKK